MPETCDKKMRIFDKNFAKLHKDCGREKRKREVKLPRQKEIREEFEAMKKKTKKMMLGLVAALVAAVIGAVIYKAKH